MATVKDIINEVDIEAPFTIMYRITAPKAFVEETGEEDMLFGYCEWDGKELRPLDGDSYYLDDDVLNYYIHETEAEEKILCVVIRGDWIGGNGESIDEFMDDENLDYTPRTKKRAERRRNDYRKAVRKRKLSAAITPGEELYGNLHQYSKNKIHCSCPMCTAKTNTKRYRGGAVPGHVRGMHIGTTNQRLGKNYTASDRRKVETMKERLKEYESGSDQTADSQE